VLFCSILFFFCVFYVFIGFWRKGSISGSIGLKEQIWEKARSWRRGSILLE
jgi:hypothetical protein